MADNNLDESASESFDGKADLGSGFDMSKAVEDVLIAVDEIYSEPEFKSRELVSAMVQKYAGDQKIPTVVFSGRITSQHVIISLLAARTGINIKNISSGGFELADWTRLYEQARPIMKIPLIMDRSSIFLDDICDRIRTLHHQGIRLAIVDYDGVLALDKTFKERNKFIEAQELLQAVSRETGVKVLLLGDFPRTH